MDKKEIGLRIKTIRKEKGLSQKELAALMGYKDVSTIAKIETGVNDVTTETLYKLANYLSVDIRDILKVNAKYNNDYVKYIRSMVGHNKIIMNEKTFYIYVVSCMIIIPASELISEIFDLGFIQSFILTIYGIIGGLLSFAKLYYNIKQSGIKWQDIFFISLFGFSFIALIFSKDIENSITGLDYDELPTHFLAYYSLMYSAFQLEKTKHRRSVIYIFAGLSFFEGIIGIFQSFEIKIQDVMFDISDHQVYGLTQNTNFFGGLSVIFVGITLALLVFSKKKLTLIVNSIGFAIAIYCSFNTMARLAWVGDLAVFTFMIISIVIMKIKKINGIRLYKKRNKKL